MDKFTHTREYYIKLVEEKQQELLLIARKNIYDKVMESINNSSGNIVIPFDTRLDNVHRKTLIKELLSRFYTLNLIKDTTSQPQGTVTEFCICDESGIIDDITSVCVIL